jgi:hypothetical protein
MLLLGFTQRRLIILPLWLLVIAASSCRDTSADDVSWMMAYWKENANHYSLPRVDAEHMAHACIDYDRLPRQRFVELFEAASSYGTLLGDTFRSYDPSARRFTDTATTETTASGPVRLTKSEKLAILLLQKGDQSNVSFLTRIVRQDSPKFRP